MGWLRSLRLVGPAVAVGMGYIDPGNWSTDVAAGRYGLTLLWIVMLSGALAFVLQYGVMQWTMHARCDLATAIVQRWPRFAWAALIVMETSIIITDVAELTGILIGTELLFRLPTALCVGVALFFISVLLAIDARRRHIFSYALCFIFLLLAGSTCFEAHALWSASPRTLIGIGAPSNAANMFPIIVGIVGATVMPHNLFLHSALIARTCEHVSQREQERQRRFYARETAVVLGTATVLNCGILAIGAALPGSDGSIVHAHHLLAKIVGVRGADIFIGAFLLSGVAASATATIAGDAVITASPIRCSPLARRAIALLPATALLLTGMKLDPILLGSQIVLGAVLPMIILPFVMLALEQKRKGAYTAPIVPLLIATAVTLSFDLAAMVMPLVGLVSS